MKLISEIGLFKKENTGTDKVISSSEENIPVANGIPLTANGHMKSE